MQALIKVCTYHSEIEEDNSRYTNFRQMANVTHDYYMNRKSQHAELKIKNSSALSSF